MEDKNQTLRVTNVKRKITKFLCMFVFVFVFFSVYGVAHAATLYFTPSSGSYNIGQTFSVSVYVGSTDQSMNAVSGTVSFLPDKVELVSLSKSGSIIALWVQEPSFSNGAGTATFEGIVLNPGYTGSAGKIITLNFKAKQAGVATLSFTTSSVLANDGKGTNILTGSGTGSYSLGSAPAESTSPTVSSGAPQAPKIISLTHSDPNQWYAKQDAVFNWVVPNDVVQVRVLYDKFPYSQPNITYNASVNKKELTGISDGVWYFHAQFQNDSGRSAVSHFRFQIDTEKPDSFEISQVSSSDQTDPVGKFYFTATDKLSGIGNFEVKIDNNSPEDWNGSSGEMYVTKPLSPGKHTILVKVFDKAGNYVTDSMDFEIKPLETPMLTDVKKEFSEGDIISFRGNTKYHDKGDTVLVRIQTDSQPIIERTQRTIGKDGNFTFILDDQKLDPGAYNIWLRAVDSRGAESEDSPKRTFAIVSAGFLEMGGTVVSYLTLLLLIILLISAAVLTVLYSWHKYSVFKRRIRQESSEANMAIIRAFASLRDEVKKQISLIDGKEEISDQERRVSNRLREALKISEKYIARKVKDIDGR